MSTDPPRSSIRITGTRYDATTFPPQELGFKVGMAFSGGGARACAFTAGILSKLYELQMLSRVNIISSNSGSGWAVVPLGYLPVVDIGGSPPHTIDEMLRPISDTELMAMTVADLKAAIPLTSILIGSASPLFPGPSAIMASLILSAGNRAWCNGIGISMFKPHNLYTHEYLSPTPMYLTQHDAKTQMETFNFQNAFFKRDNFPFMVHMASVLHYSDITNQKTAAPFDFTAVSSGSYGPTKSLLCARGQPRIKFDGRMSTSCFDALFVETNSPPNDTLFATLRDAARTSNFEKPFTPFDVAAISSCAFASSTFDAPFDFLIPRYIAPQATYSSSNVPRLADGANTDNLAIVPLVLRGVSKIISVISSDSGLSSDPSKNVCIDIQKLFMQVPSTDPAFVSLPIFAGGEQQYRYIMNGLFNSHAQFGTAWFSAQLETITNSDIGLVAGIQFDVTFVFMTACSSYTENVQGKNAAIGKYLVETMIPNNFPNYATISEDFWTAGRVFMLTPEKARMLYLLGAFYVEDCIMHLISKSEIHDTAH